MRKQLDKLVSWFGLALTVFLVVAGALLTWGSSFVGNQVHDQLAVQDITMPSGAALDALPPADKAALEPYAGQPMTTGPQAEAYANHFILVHMNEGTDTLFKTLQGLGHRHRPVAEHGAADLLPAPAPWPMTSRTRRRPPP